MSDGQSPVLAAIMQPGSPVSVSVADDDGARLWSPTLEVGSGVGSRPGWQVIGGKTQPAINFAGHIIGQADEYSQHPTYLPLQKLWQSQDGSGLIVAKRGAQNSAPTLRPHSRGL